MVSKPVVKVIYLGRDITRDLEEFLLAVTYNDKVSGEADEICIELEDPDGLWAGPWYPQKGDKVEVRIGYEGSPLLPCGVFELDEIELSGPPDTLSMRGLSAGISGTMRTKRSSAHEQIPLRKIAETIAERHGLTVVDGTAREVDRRVTFGDERTALTGMANGVRDLKNTSTPIAFNVQKNAIAGPLQGAIEVLRKKGETSGARDLEQSLTVLSSSREYGGHLEGVATTIDRVAASLKDRQFQQTVSKLDGITVDRVTQNEETDLAFLKRLAADYGLVFTVRDTQLIFTAVADIEKADGVMTLRRSDIGQYRFRDKSVGTVKKARVKYHDPDNKALTEATVTAEDGDLEYDPTTAGDDEEFILRSENPQQAESKAKARLHQKNSETHTASIDLPGSVLMVSGANVTLIQFGKNSGRYTITESTHTFTRGGGYTTSCELKKVGAVAENLQQRDA